MGEGVACVDVVTISAVALEWPAEEHSGPWPDL